MSKLLIEDSRHGTEHRLEVLNETVKGKKTTFIEGIFAQAEVQNGNKRVYPNSVLGPEVERYIEKYVKTNRAIGELNHPEHPTPNPERASHLVTELKMEGNNAIGRAAVLNNMPCGEMVKALLENGVNIGVSTRGLGSTKKVQGIDTVDQYSMYAIDVVADPSAPDAFVKGIMEGLDRIAEQNNISGVVIDELLKEEIDEMTRAKSIINFIGRLSK